MESIETRHALFPIVQGSMFADLRRECARRLVELDADGYAVGGLSVGRAAAAESGNGGGDANLLPRDRPRYAMGVGMPDELPEYVARGIDMMDCVLPSRNARNGWLFTSRGPGDHQARALSGRSRPARRELRLLYLPKLIRGPICGTCFRRGEILFASLATRHNLHRYLDIMREIRQAILLGTFPRIPSGHAPDAQAKSRLR